MDVPLREGYLDTGLAQPLFDRIVEFAQGDQPLLDLTDETAQLEVQGTVAESLEQHQRRTDSPVIHHHQGVCLGHTQEHFGDLVDIRTVGHTDRYGQAPPGVPEHPVGDIIGDQHGVRHDDIGAVKGLDQGGPDTDPTHIAFHIPGDDPIAGANRALEQQDDAGNEVIDDVLQAEADTDRQGTGDNRQIRQTEPRQ